MTRQQHRGQFVPHDQDISVPRAAALLGVSPRTMHRIIDQGLVPYTRPAAAVHRGAHKRVRRSDVLALKRSVQGEGVAPVLPSVVEDVLND